MGKLDLGLIAALTRELKADDSGAFGEYWCP